MPPSTTTPASIISDAIASLKHAATVALSKSEEQAQAELLRALSDARQAKNQRDEALNSLRTVESEQIIHKEQLEAWKATVDKADLTIEDQAGTIAELRQENIHWKDQFARVEKSCQEWKEQFTRVEQERISLLARLEELTAQQELGNISGSPFDYYSRYGEHATSPPSSPASMTIGSVSTDKAPSKRQQLEAVVIPYRNKPSKAAGSRKFNGKPSTGGTKTQAKITANATRPVKDKAAPKQKAMDNPEGSVTKGPVTQRVIRRVHATVEVPVKVEDDEDELVRTPVIDANGRTPSDKDPKPSTSTKKTAKSTEPSRVKSKSWQAHRDDDVTPPAPPPVPRRRKSGVDPDYYEPNDDSYNWRSLDNSNVRNRPPSRRKSIKELRESDFEYQEEEDETDADELNLGGTFEHDTRPGKPTKQQRVNGGPSNPPARKNGRKRKAVDAMGTDEPVVSGRGTGKAIKTR